MTSPTLRPGDHIKVRRYGAVYAHHFVIEAPGRVIHFDGEPLQAGPIRIVRASLAEVLSGGRPRPVRHRQALPRRDVIARARQALTAPGDRYNLLFNNCEHFATWCKTGRHRSFQVERAAVLVGGAMLAPLLIHTAQRAWDRSQVAGSGT